MRRRISPPILLAATLAAACATTGVNQGDFNLVSLEDEWELGRKLEADLAKELTLIEDPAAQAYLDRVGGAIIARTEMRQLPWKLHIVADPQINAFNIPGGHVYVNRGLILAAPDVAAFAGVLAHEISHGVARHATEQLSRAYGLNIVAGLVLGENPAVYQQILAQIAATGAVARFSREAELEADTLGVRAMHAAGYDPEGMARMFTVHLAERRERPNAVQRFFATHPLTEERIAEVRREAAALPGGSGLIRTDAGFQELQRRVRDAR